MLNQPDVCQCTTISKHVRHTNAGKSEKDTRTRLQDLRWSITHLLTSLRETVLYNVSKGKQPATTTEATMAGPKDFKFSKTHLKLPGKSDANASANPERAWHAWKKRSSASSPQLQHGMQHKTGIISVEACRHNNATSNGQLNTCPLRTHRDHGTRFEPLDSNCRIEFAKSSRAQVPAGQGYSTGRTLTDNRTCTCLDAMKVSQLRISSQAIAYSVLAHPSLLIIRPLVRLKPQRSHIPHLLLLPRLLHETLQPPNLLP